MRSPLILRHAGWPGLLAELAGRQGWTQLRDIAQPAACALLAAPAAIARWIALRAPELARKPVLSLLIIGAETTDAPDQGRWYQLLPQLLDAAGAITPTLVGPELDLDFASSAAALAPHPPARWSRAALDEFLARHDPLQFDLAVVFHPGLQKHRHWLADSGFARLLAAGVPLVASSYEADEYDMDRWVLECYGYRASAEPLLNPYFLELGDERARVRWGRALWQFEAAPPPGHAVDAARLAALDELTRMVMHSMTAVALPAPEYGARVALETGEGARLELIHVFDNRFVDLASGRTWHLAASGELLDTGGIPPDALASYPGAAAREIERAVWAAQVKARYLLGSYHAHAEADVSSAAGAMLAAMREKASKLFGR